MFVLLFINLILTQLAQNPTSYKLTQDKKITASEIHKKYHTEFWNVNVSAYDLAESIRIAAIDQKKYSSEQIFKDSSILWLETDEIDLFTDTNSAYWVIFSVQNTQPRDFSGYFFFNAWAKIDFYQLDSEKNIIDFKKTGNYLPLKDRDIQNRRTTFVKNVLHKGDISYYAVRLERGGDDLWLGKSSKKIMVLLSEESEILQGETGYRLAMGISVGLISMLILFTIILYLLTKNISSLLNGLFLFFWEMFYISAHGLSFEYFWPNSISWDMHSQAIFLTLCLVSLSLFFRYGFSLKETNKSFDTFYKYLSIASISVIITQLLNMSDLNRILLNLLFTITFFSGVVISYKVWKKGNEAAKFTFIGLCYIHVFQLYIFLAQVGLIPYYYGAITVFDLAQYGAALQISLYCYSLVHTYKKTLENIAKEEAIRNLLEIETSSIKELEQNKSRFFSNISHELRTPLTLIINPLDHFLTTQKNSLAHKILEPALRSARKLTTLVNQLLELAQMDENRLSLTTEKSDLVKALKRVSSNFSSYAQNKEVTFKTQFNYDELICDLDFDKIDTIISNLLSNAFKFTHKGSVELSLEQSNEKIFISVKDSGIGIPGNELAFLFDRFYQVDRSDTREYEGSGIGLSLVKELVTLHNGTIKTTSKVGIGTEFIIQLPHINSPETPERKRTDTTGSFHSESEFPATESLGETSKTVLIVEDQKDLRDYIKLVISEASYNTLEASNGLKALEIAKRKLPDIIITDIMMPKMSGIELISELQNDIETDHIPIIILSGKADIKTKHIGLRSGAIDYLEKPFSNAELIDKIYSICNQQEKYKTHLLQAYSSNSTKNLKNKDEQLLFSIRNAIQEHISESDLTVKALSSELGLSESSLLRKVKHLTGKSVSELIRTTRLDFSKQLIEESAYSISEALYASGFQSSSYFSKSFKEQFGISPSELQKR